jgi:hypothetical protein
LVASIATAASGVFDALLPQPTISAPTKNGTTQLRSSLMLWSYTETFEARQDLTHTACVQVPSITYPAGPLAKPDPRPI